MAIFSEFWRRVISASALTIAMSAAPLVQMDVAFAETAVPAEKNPPGDIPDSQVFIDYKSSLGFSMKVPEGWARKDMADGASFIDKLDGVIITSRASKQKPDIATAKSEFVDELRKSERAVKVSAVKAVKLPSGEAIRIVYTSNSEPNAVTNKQVRLENERYLFFKNGKLVTLELYAPKGADNVDQWQLMSRSFTWN